MTNLYTYKVFRISFAVFLVFLTAALRAQDYMPEIDSLLKVAKNAPDSVKSDHYSAVCWKLRNYAPDSALMYGKIALKYAEKTGNVRQRLRSMSFVGVCERNVGNYGAAFEIYNKGLDLALKHGIKDQAAYSYINIGNLYLYHDKYEPADSILMKALSIAEEIQDSSIWAYAALNLGRINLGLKKPEKAAGYLRVALSLREARHEEWDGIATVRKYLGDALLESGHPDEAMVCYQGALPSGTYILKDYDLLSDLYGRVSSIYCKRRLYDSALYYGREGVRISELRGIALRIKNAEKYLGDVFMEMRNLDSAVKHYNVVMCYTDTFISVSNVNSISNFETRLSEVKHEAEIEIMKKDKEIQRIYFWITAGVILVLLIGGVLVFRSNVKTRRTNRLLNEQKEEILQKNDEISAQRDVLMSQKKEITDSIKYAKRIQFSMMPAREILLDYFTDGFVFHAPRDVVSGDFWWAFHDEDYFILVCADCTGHGVPGAFMSMLGFSSLNEVVGRDRKRKAADIMNSLRELVKKTVNQNINDGAKIQDGMDAALIVINKKTNILDYAGANIPFLCFRGDEEIVVKSTHNPVGVYPAEVPFTSTEIQLEKGDKIYLTSDGYYSQFGGPNDRIMKTSGYKKIVRSVKNFDMFHQKQIVEESFLAWKGKKNQTDDVLVIGMEV